ncbi:MAG TPA: hypothetical protein VFO83_08475 [Aggregicoccus sp.]|nr:hypothetical protein [Aggregicoccus sp.]
MRSPSPFRLALLLLALAAAPALAKPWQGIEPGVSRREDVLARFGAPSRTVKPEPGKPGPEILAYLSKRAIRGTTQVQFKLDAATGVVERIDVFPAPVIEREAIENTYGAACPAGPLPEQPCFLKKITDDFRSYYLYPRLGLAVFFNEDGKTVNSFIFTTMKAAK